MAELRRPRSQKRIRPSTAYDVYNSGGPPRQSADRLLWRQVAGQGSSKRYPMARFDEKVKSLIAVAFCNLLIAFCLLSLPACAVGNDQGVLEIRLKDHREAIDDFAKLGITIDKILISPKPGLMFWQTGWKELTPSTATIDLTQTSTK